MEGGGGEWGGGSGGWGDEWRVGGTVSGWWWDEWVSGVYCVVYIVCTI